MEILKPDLKELKELEELAIDAAAKVIQSVNELCMHIYDILEDGLFLSHVDEKGLPVYPTQDIYLNQHLLPLLGFSRATLFSYYRVSRLALGDFNLSKQEFVEQGGYNTWSAVAKNVKLNRRGQLVSLKRDDIPDSEAKEFILKQLEDVKIQQNRENLDQGQVTALLANALDKQSNRIMYRLIERDNMYRTMWESTIDGIDQSGFIDDLNTPSIVLEHYCRKLGIQL